MTKPKYTNAKDCYCEDDEPTGTRFERPECLDRVIDILQDRYEEDVPNIEAPPWVIKVLNVMFITLGVTLFLGVLIAVAITSYIDEKDRGPDVPLILLMESHTANRQHYNPAHDFSMSDVHRETRRRVTD